MFAIAGAMEPWQHFFFVKEIRKGSVSPTRPSATPPTSCTWIGHANADRARFFQVHALVEHISPRSTTCLQQDRARAKDLENAIYPPNLFLFRKKKWERARARERELQWRERVVAHTSVGHTSSRSATCLHNLLPSWRKRAKERDLFSTAFSSSKNRLWEVFNDGESSRKNLNILQASASKLSGFTPRIQPSACGLGLYNARCKTR